MKKIVTLLSIAIVLLSVGCSKSNANNEKDNNKTNKDMNTQIETSKEKVLVVFFSMAGEQYSVGNIEVGNTKIVADYICKHIGCNQFEIVAEKNYNMPYNKLIQVAKEEANKGELPSYKGKIDNIDQYSTIFIGGPVWWGTYPQVMFTFFKDYDLNNKTIIPFTTHEGSGLASCVEDIKEAYPKANVLKGFSIYGHEVRTNEAKVIDWLKGLGF
ncbi:MAG: flavodoxin [Bacteroidales bacterium]|nr:flavodoxin [Bacteroidales bacterium]